MTTQFDGRQFVMNELKFEELQEALLWAFASEIRSALYQARLPAGLADVLTKHLTQKISNILDGRRVLKSESGDSSLRLSFKLGEQIIGHDGEAWTNEALQSTLEALFSEAPP